MIGVGIRLVNLVRPERYVRAFCFDNPADRPIDLANIISTAAKQGVSLFILSADENPRIAERLLSNDIIPRACPIP